MPNQKISELTAIVTVDNSVDVLPIVDISANTTKKVTPNALKTALALDNVNNTSDANKPVSIAQQDALNAKVDENAPIVAATKTKITYDAKGLVTAGDILDAADMPTGISAANIGTGVVSSTEFGYLDGVTSAIQTQIDGKQATLVSGTNIKTVNSTSLLGSGDVAVQATLVSGTNIKTINSTSLLGSGDITISASPSGVSGAIQFSNGSAFASDAANLFWDDTNKRLGIGTNAPTTALQINYSSSTLNGLLINQTGGTGNFSNIGFANGGTIRSTFGMNLNTGEVRWFNGSGGYFATIYGNGVEAMRIDGSQNVNIGATALGARVGIKGSGSTSATTSLLVQTSAGLPSLQVLDSRSVRINGGSGNGLTLEVGGTLEATSSSYLRGGVYGFNGFFAGMNSGESAVAIIQADSTTKGFLPPRMTTTQKNAITAVAGLVVYDSTTNKLQCYNGSTWNDLF